MNILESLQWIRVKINAGLRAFLSVTLSLSFCASKPSFKDEGILRERFWLHDCSKLLVCFLTSYHPKKQAFRTLAKSTRGLALIFSLWFLLLLFALLLFCWFLFKSVTNFPSKLDNIGRQK
jgi:hypothetical protein